jgi:hypothetical protein
VRDIGITHGDETKVGYYVGLMVRLPSFTVIMMAGIHALFMMRAIAISFLFSSSTNCIALESDFGPDRPQTSYSDWTMRLVYVDVLLRSVENILGSCSQVRFPTSIKDL